jgi:WD40 repeat protein
MSEDGTLQFWAVSSSSLLGTLSEALYDFDISSDGRILALGSLDGTIKVWGVYP